MVQGARGGHEVALSREGDRWAEARSTYLAALLAGDSAAALAIASAHAAPESLGDLFHSVLQPAMYEIGERWEAGTLSIAMEHLASAITTRVISALYAHRVIPKAWRGKVVVTAGPNEIHELGAWMVSDLLELDGWEVSYLGANTPLKDLVELVRDRAPTFVALSVTMPFNLAKAQATIATVKRDLAPTPVPFLVGGRSFNYQPNLWREVGADAWAMDAREAVVQARTFGRHLRER